MSASLAQKDSFPPHPVEVRVRVEKFRQEKSIHRMFVCDATGFATIAVFGDLPRPIVEGKCYSFMVSLGKEFRGQRDLTMNGTSFPYSEIPAIRVPDDPVSVTSAIIQPGYRYCVRARVRKDGMKTFARDDRTLYLWTIDLSDEKTHCPVKIWGDAADPLPHVRDGLYDIYCLSYVPSQNPQYPVGHFDAKNARWVCIEANAVQSSILPSSAPNTPAPEPVSEPAPQSTPQGTAPPVPRMLIGAIGAAPHLPADCTAILQYFAEFQEMSAYLRNVFMAAAKYEKIHGPGSFYATEGAVDTLAILRDGTCTPPIISAAAMNFLVDVVQIIRNFAPKREF